MRQRTLLSAVATEIVFSKILQRPNYSDIAYEEEKRILFKNCFLFS